MSIGSSPSSTTDVSDAPLVVAVSTGLPELVNESPSSSESTHLRPARDDAPQLADKRRATPSRIVLLRDLLSILFAVALGAGLTEATYWMVSRFAFGRLTFLPVAGIWLTPLAYLIQFCFLLLPIMVWGTVFRRSAAVTCALAAAVFCGVFTQLLVVGHLSLPAQTMLAAGAATVAMRSFVRHPATWLMWLRIIAVLSTAALLGAVGIERGGAAWREQRAKASLPPVLSSLNHPSVLLLVLDTVRADCLGITGASPSPSPRLDAFSERGFTFRQATATAPWTLPSTASMFTGRMPHETSTGWHAPLHDEPPILAEELSQRGYETAGFVANAYCASETGLARGFVHYDDFSKSLSLLLRCTAAGRRLVLSDIPLRMGVHLEPGRRSAGEINTAFLQWTERRKDRPFFAFLNYMDAHDPYLARSPHDGQRPQTLDDRRLVEFWWWMNKDGVTRAQSDYLRSSYVDCIRYLDSQIGELLSELDTRHMLDNTWVIITADHGEHFGDHDLYGHGNSLYQAVIHVPLVIVPPGGHRGVQIDTPVSLQDLPATILEIVGGLNTAIPGSPLLAREGATWSASNADRDALFAEIDEPCFMPPCHGRSPVFRGVMRSVRIGQFKYIRIQDGTEELYDLASDPEEMVDLAKSPALSAVRDRLRSRLSALTGEPLAGSGNHATYDQINRTSTHVHE